MKGLTPLELALFIECRIEAGDSQAEIARRLGKSRPYFTYATALVGAPDWLMALYRRGVAGASLNCTSFASCSCAVPKR